MMPLTDHRMQRFVLLSIMSLAVAAAADGQAPVDSALARYINAIRAIDEHAHPMRPVAGRGGRRHRFRRPAARRHSGVRPAEPPQAGRSDLARRPERALRRSPGRSIGAAYHTALKAAVSDAARAGPELSRTGRWTSAGIDVMLANRIALGPGLAAPRFRWIAFADPLMLPLDNSAEATRTPDTRPLYPRETKLLQRYLRDLERARRSRRRSTSTCAPSSAPTLARQRAAGAVGIKFEAAYLRPLDFDDPGHRAARSASTRGTCNGGVPSRAEYKTLQDYLFRAIAREAGRQKLAVQIHVLETFGGFYSPRGSAPHLLEPAFNDSTLRGRSSSSSTAVGRSSGRRRDC